MAAVKLYLQSVIWGCESPWRRVHEEITNHVMLLDKINHWRTRKRRTKHVWLVTFNYDRLVESALQLVSRP